jgi:hypothetical protein
VLARGSWVVIHWLGDVEDGVGDQLGVVVYGDVSDPAQGEHLGIGDGPREEVAVGVKRDSPVVGGPGDADRTTDVGQWRK